jgi:Holliday junction resolvasome RuvABC endonuclease subunit
MGLDCSTTTIGICILDYDGYSTQIVLDDYYKPDKSLGELIMLQKAREYILNLFVKFKVQELAIEDYIRFFKGNSSAKTIIPLAIINTTIRLAILDLGIIPESLNVLKIRHTLKLTKELPKKEDIPELVAKHLGIDYPWRYKINKRTKQQVVMIESYDVADALAVGLASIYLKTAPKKKSRPKTTRKSKAK